MHFWMIAVVIIGFAVVGQIVQTVKSKQSQKALASDDATAILKGTKGLFITEVDGHSLFVREIPLIPGTHRISFQISESGGQVNLPVETYELESGVTWVHWSGMSKKDVQVWLDREGEA